MNSNEFGERYSNWNRWGSEDQVGAVNLIDRASIVAASRLVRSGITISLSHEFPTTPASNNPRPATKSLQLHGRNGAGAATETLSIDYHGLVATHLDALCHVWDELGMWNGREPDTAFGDNGAVWGDVTAWRNGIITRGVFVDICRFRGADCVVIDQPVIGSELAAAVESTGLSIEPGNALVVYSGREKWDELNGEFWGSQRLRDGQSPRPGLDTSCVDYFRDVDCSVLIWDMADAFPNKGNLVWPVHRAIIELGITLVDNANLGPLAEHCSDTDVNEFMLLVSPLVIPGGTGSPVNPIALF